MKNNCGKIGAAYSRGVISLSARNSARVIPSISLERFILLIKGIYLLYFACLLIAIFYPTLMTVILFFLATILCYLSDPLKKRQKKSGQSDQAQM